LRNVNDERICQAVVAMLARAGVKVSLNAQARSTHFDKVLTRNTSFYLIGWTPATYDAHNPLVSLMVTPNGAEGTFNLAATRPRGSMSGPTRSRSRPTRRGARP
jgi:peptide/nickel transport system substrate-binding protein